MVIRMMEPDDMGYAKRKGVFNGFVLLADKSWDKDKFKRDLEADWGLQPDYDEGDGSRHEDQSHCDALIIDLGSQRVAVGYMDIPVPGGEAEQNAAYNYTWPNAVEVTKTHQAQILVTVIGEHQDAKKDGELFVKMMAALCKQPNAIGVYANGVVYQPEFYFAMKEFIEKGMYPLMGLVWFGVLRAELGYHIYTIGMNSFGMDDMEILGTAEDPKTVKDFLMNIASYCIEEDVILHDGETIGLSSTQRCRISRSPGVCVNGMTLKIEYSS
ncbi:MAG: DUF4261 domain-containing protein [Acetatifactor sp.]|nr:DUF4261 domain-containing protein [Acetatifactor sp.]